ncbi:MAG: helix-turn-helix domain-containing protein [Ruminococcaceae bacterium]|nr:helix-turn-helix domain-containing protein [Oscillospiraceae bacterium]
MNYSTLNDLIDALEYGNKLHIGVCFLGNYGNEKLILPFEKQIHSSPVCDEMKSRTNGYRRCFYCRNAAIKRSISTQKSFDGLCINGVYEYTRPVIIDGETACVIFVGNIMPEDKLANKLMSRLENCEHLISSLEHSFNRENCEKVANIVESYIRMLLEIKSENDSNENFDPLIENMKNYIEVNIEYNIDIKHLANIFHYNEKYLGRLFKRKTGYTFSEYINHRRIERGRELLVKNSESVINISSKIGFNNVTYFNRLFKRAYGLTPSEYRQKRKL